MRTSGGTLKAERRALWRAAATLGLKRPRGKQRRALPTVFFVTDPDRVPNPLAVAARLPRGTGVIYRGFGRPGAEATAHALAALARRRGLVLLIGQDERLAARIGAQGVHVPERDLHRARRLRARRPNWILTGAAHGPSALARRDRGGLDALLLSVVFESGSPSASRPIGPVRLARLARGASVPVIALGGVNSRTAKRLLGTGVAGFAGVEGLL